MVLVVAKSVDALSKGQEGGVDIPSLLQSVSCVVGTGVALGSSKVAE